MFEVFVDYFGRTSYVILNFMTCGRNVLIPLLLSRKDSERHFRALLYGPYFLDLSGLYLLRHSNVHLQFEFYQRNTIR